MSLKSALQADEALKILRLKLSELLALGVNSKYEGSFNRWHMTTSEILKRYLNHTQYRLQFLNIRFSPVGYWDADAFANGRIKAQACLEAAIEHIERFGLAEPNQATESPEINMPYDVAQICVNGHVVNECAQSLSEFNAPHCAKCGAETITACPECKTEIRGAYHSPGVFSATVMLAPPYCWKCGKAYPWTASALAAARMLAEEIEGLSASEREQLKSSLDDIVRDVPQTTVAATRFKRLKLQRRVMAQPRVSSKALLKS